MFWRKIKFLYFYFSFFLSTSCLECSLKGVTHMYKSFLHGELKCFLLTFTYKFSKLGKTSSQKHRDIFNWIGYTAYISIYQLLFTQGSQVASSFYQTKKGREEVQTLVPLTAIAFYTTKLRALVEAHGRSLTLSRYISQWPEVIFSCR
jgi:hypothetical protein